MVHIGVDSRNMGATSDTPCHQPHHSPSEERMILNKNQMILHLPKIYKSLNQIISHHLPDWAWQTRGLPPSPVHASFPFSVPAHTLFKGPYLSFSHILGQIFLFKLDTIEHNLISYLSLCELEPIPNTRFLLVESLLQSRVALCGRYNWHVHLLRCFVKFRYWCLLYKSLSHFSYVEPTLCWMNWKDPENSSLPHPAVQHL